MEGLLATLIVFRPIGNRESPFSTDDFASVGQFLSEYSLDYRTHQTGMEIELGFGPDSGSRGATLVVNTEARNPDLGSGCLTILNVPVEPDPALALELNIAEASNWTGAHFLGGWCAGSQGLAFVHFVPSLTYRRGLLDNLVVNAGSRASFCWSYLDHNEQT